MTTYQELMDLVEKDLATVRKTSIKNNTYEIIDYAVFCYNRKQQFRTPWNDAALKARGVVYDITNTEQPRRVNSPYPKIFNLNEHPSTDVRQIAKLIHRREHMNILEKLNGHLLISTYDSVNNKMLLHTKGSFTGEIIDNDYQLLYDINLMDKLYNYQFEKSQYKTLMFEVLADHDIHLHTKKQQEEYLGGKEGIVLIGATTHNGNMAMYSDLLHIGKFLDIPVVKNIQMDLYDENKDIIIDRLNDLLKSQDAIEGYVLNFWPSQTQVKFKTNKYFNDRYLFKLGLHENGVENAKQKYSTTDLRNLYENNVEELYPLWDALDADYEHWFKNIWIPSILDEIFSNEALDVRNAIKDINEDDDITSGLKHVYFKIRRLYTDPYVKSIFNKSDVDLIETELFLQRMKG